MIVRAVKAYGGKIYLTKAMRNMLDINNDTVLILKAKDGKLLVSPYKDDDDDPHK